MADILLLEAMVLEAMVHMVTTVTQTMEMTMATATMVIVTVMDMLQPHIRHHTR